MTAQYRLVHFVPDPFLGGRVPIAALLRTPDGVQVVRVPHLPGPHCLGGRARAATVQLVVEDLEAVADRRFDAIVVTNYLFRPRLPLLLTALNHGGVLIYETFMVGNERFGKPSRPEFLLKDGELLDLVRGRFSVTAYEARMISEPRMAMVQRIAARKTS